MWIATYSHEDSVLRLLVNGQTGEVVSPKLPKSWAKIFGLIAAFLAVAGLGTIAVLVLASLLGAL